MIDKGSCDKGFIWNPSNCECECDTSCDATEYEDYENCKCRKKLADLHHIFFFVFLIVILFTAKYINYDKKKFLKRALFLKQQFTELLNKIP